MRYRVFYVKLKNLPNNVSQTPPSDTKINVRKPELQVQQPENMILVESPDSGFAERTNAISKMVNTETPEDLREIDQKATFQYQIPRVRASFTLKVAPDSTTASLPEPTPTNELANSTERKEIFCVPTLPSEVSLPIQYGPHLPEYDPMSPEMTYRLPDFRPRIPSHHPPVINHIPRIHKPVIANRSAHYYHTDDKDFEIPLEESLRAVEEFIKREREMSKWHVGEDVLARWKGNGLFYKAKILEIIPTGVVLVLYDTYDIKEEIDHRDLCKYYKKTSNFKKKGRAQENPKGRSEKINKISAKKLMKMKKKKKTSKKLPFVSVFKRSDRLRKKRLFACHKKSQNLPIITMKTQTIIPSTNS